MRRCLFGTLALGLTLVGTGGADLAAAGLPGDPGGLSGVTATETPPAPAAEAPAGAPPAAEVPAPAGEPAPPALPAPAESPQPVAEDPPSSPPPSQPRLFPEEGEPAPNVSNVSLTGEAYVVRQDFKAPLELLLGRYPRATLEVSKDLSTAFGSFADPGFLGRFAVAAAGEPANDKAVSSPAWAECLFPASPLTPTEDTRSPAQGVAASAVAKCYEGAAQAGGYVLGDPDADAGLGVPVLSTDAAVSTVDAASNAAGATITQSVSTLENVTLVGRVTIKSLTNVVTVRTNGRPGGAVVDTSATISGLSVENVPVELPSDALAQAGPVLEQLPPILSPLGVVTFDVIPEQREAAADGTAGAGRAAQLQVTIQNGEGTVSFGLGFASARGRTILNDFTVPGTGAGTGPRIREPRVIPGYSGPLRPATGSATMGDFVDSVGRSLGFRAPGRSSSGAAGGRMDLPAGFGAGGLPTAGLDLLPPLPPNQAQAQNAGETEQYGGDGPWLALIGGSVIGLALARYLAYSMAVRPTAA